MRDEMMVESSTMLFSREFEDLHDDGFDGSTDEQRIFSEIFFGSDGSRKKGFMVSEATIIHCDCIKGTDMSLCSNSGKSSLTSHNFYAKEDFSRKCPLEYLSSMKSNHEVKSLVEDHPDVKLDLGDTLCAQAPSERVVSDISLENSISAGHTLTYRVVESSGQGVMSGSYQLKPIPYQGKVCELSGRGSCKNRVSSLDQNDQKEAVHITVTSPISQESYASRLLATDPSTSVANRIGTHRLTKPKWKDACFLQLDEDELAMPKDIKNDPRPLLRYHIYRLLRAAGWLIGRRRRNSKYNGIGEYVYKCPGGRPIREFHRAWNMCGESLLTDANLCLQTSDCIQWADMTELWTDLSRIIQQIDDKLNILEDISAMAHLWCLLDPFANVVFIEKTIRLLKEGITVKANRSSVITSGAGSVVKYRKISSSGRSCVDPMSLQNCGYDESNQIDVGLFDVPISSGGLQSLEEFETVFTHQDCSTSSPITDQIIDKEEVVFGQVRKSHKKSRKISEMKLNGSHLNGQPMDEINSVRCGSKKSKACRLNDDDLLISAIMKTKICRTTNKWSTRKSKPLRKRKTRKGSCRLLPRSLKKGAKHILEGKWSAVGLRTVLSWLIHSGVVSLSEAIQYRNLKDDTVIKDGLVTRDGILCKCCNTIFSISKFKIHAGFRLNRPCANLFMESGKPFTLCQLEAWSAEYKARKVAPQTEQVDEMDQNDDSCGRCGDVGELICCDNCPSAFHQACLFEQELPEGNWYCPQCRCQICADAVSDKESSQLHGDLKCTQCEDKYHETCMQRKGMGIGLVSDTWFCGDGCYQVYNSLQSRIGLENLLSNGFSWTLLRCIPSDQKVHSAQRVVALRAECNSKLSVAITIMEECFLPMVDIKTGIDMIPQVIFNWGSQFARLNYSGFYTVVLEKDDVVLCVASIRIHGVKVAELPLVATCSRYRRQGMCRRLINAIEEMLKSLKVEKLVISAIPDLVDTWTLGFGFERLEEEERQSLSKTNLMVFPGAVWLKKMLYDNCNMDERNGSDDLDSIQVGAHERGSNAEQEDSVDSFAAKEDCITTAEALQFCRGNILDILQNPPCSTLYFEGQDSNPPGHNSFVEEANNEAGPIEEMERCISLNQPSRLDEHHNSFLEDACVARDEDPEKAQSGRRRNPVVFVEEFSSEESNLQVSSILCNPVLKVSPEDPVAVPPGGKLDVGCGTEAEEIHSVRQNIVFL
ncbi:increased DNA methylation 1 [Salvia miltiorrhiza]|uniref:increased DNA methylation 1 n=1 Tax=Salvia miltiorrhiza TaxID=226208 RepID=UPI0025AC2F9E|nr:increased DNA methylation 1 [Salvia miltiorrhiza]XP_057795956.1 increased DNA methylation 1 [Salvia miltiorrhiza]XP_057795957.1 increased DNA methylation 1 [Salvia miltiorrhiza]XP_057795958.1 increased DNA methylation 1 [Salvia miltiorrhiza]XP_057795959.1 increased DNA methylation 1 [Salvia miltiorrhiza]